MPSKNTIKTYVDNGFYHIYNRGVEKRVIFTDKLDESVFLKYLKEYLSPRDNETLVNTINNPSSSAKEKNAALQLLKLNNFSDEIDLLAYCLMNNHFHLLVKQKHSRTMEKFMRSLCTRYVQYFNKRNKGRVGSLFQDTYKAVLVETEQQLLHLSRYIHLNPALKGYSLQEFPQPSSYPNYLGVIQQDWVKPQEILNYFSKSGLNSYPKFVEDSRQDGMSTSLIFDFLLDP